MSILSHINLVHVFPSYPSKIHFSIIIKLGSAPGQGQEIILNSNAHRPALGHITPLIQWVPGFVLRDEEAKACDWPTPLPSAEVKNECSCISTRPHAFTVSRETNFSLSPSFVGAFVKFWKLSISFVMPVCPSARNNSDPHGTDFHEIWFLFFGKSVEKIHLSLKFYQISGYFTWSSTYNCDNISVFF